MPHQVLCCVARVLEEVCGKKNIFQDQSKGDEEAHRGLQAEESSHSSFDKVSPLIKEDLVDCKGVLVSFIKKV